MHKKASANLPTFPKRADDFYIAILPHNITVRSCEWKDFFWLKARGVSRNENAIGQAAPNEQPQKNTLGQIKKFHIRKFGTPVSFVCGDQYVTENTLLRDAATRASGDLLVFWTIVDTKRVLSHEVRPAVWDIARSMEEYWESDIPSFSMIDDAPMPVSSGWGVTWWNDTDKCRTRSHIATWHRMKVSSENWIIELNHSVPTTPISF
jgi:hypothetical protein